MVIRFIKLNLNNFIFYYQKMQLKYNTTYAVDAEHETFIGTYRGEISNKYFPPYRNLLWNVKVRIKNKSNINTNMNTDMKTNRKSSILVQYVSISNTDIVYDLDKIKYLANKAKESFEKRSLDIILKRLINEEFQWS